MLLFWNCVKIVSSFRTFQFLNHSTILNHGHVTSTIMWPSYDPGWEFKTDLELLRSRESSHESREIELILEVSRVLQWCKRLIILEGLHHQRLILLIDYFNLSCSLKYLSIYLYKVFVKWSSSFVKITWSGHRTEFAHVVNTIKRTEYDMDNRRRRHSLKTD